MNGNKQRGLVIQPRDERLLCEVGVMRVIDREQAKVVAGFGSTTRVNTRLLALYRTGLLRRFFQGTKAGGQKALYTLSEKGAQFVGARYQRFRYGNDELLATNFYVTHQLAVNRIYCAAKYEPLPVPNIAFVRWEAFSAGIAPSLLPDGYFEVSGPQGVIASFVEVDLGNEGLAVWKAKVKHYLHFATSGNFEKRFHQHRFRVLVAANTDARMQAIRSVVRRLTDKVFWLSSFEAIKREGFWAPIWLRPSGDDLRALVSQT